MKSEQDYDLVVLGGGPGGQKAAEQAVKAGWRVAIVEKERHMGGSSVLHGVLPGRVLKQTAQALLKLKRNASALHVSPRDDIEFATLTQSLEEVLQSHVGRLEGRLREQGIELVEGRASMVSPHEVLVQSVKHGKRTLSARHLVLATGSRPASPSHIPVDHEHILDSDSIFNMIYLPRSLTVLGGGLIASQYASIFAALGVRVALIDESSIPLGFLDPELAMTFLDEFRHLGGDYKGGQKVDALRWDGVSQVITELASGEVVKSDKMLVAHGRRPNLEGLGLNGIGVELTTEGFIAVNEHGQSSIPFIYAVGDVTGPPSLATWAMEQGRRAMCHAQGNDPGWSIHTVPWEIHTVPEIACVGLNEPRAREIHGAVTVGRIRLDDLVRCQISSATGGFLKLVADGEGKKLLGVQIIGEGATELIHLGASVLRHRQHVEDLMDTTFGLATLSEAYRAAAENLLRSIGGKLPNAAKKSSASMPLAA